MIYVSLTVEQAQMLREACKDAAAFLRFAADGQLTTDARASVDDLTRARKYDQLQSWFEALLEQHADDAARVECAAREVA